MIKIDSDYLDNYKCIGAGKFGKIYKIDDNTAYKIYYSKVVDNYTGIELINPALVCNRTHYKLLLSKSKNLNHSGGINDFIYVDGKFGGVSIPYHKGLELINELDRPLKLKIDLSKKIVRNCKELTDNFIYPTDFRLKNIILNNDNPQIIDLDDTRTKVRLIKDPILEAFCINIIGESIQYYLGLYKHHGVPFTVKKNIKRDNAFNCIHYEKIIDYINNLEKEKNIVFINKESDLDILKELVFNNSFEAVYILENEKNKKEYIHTVKKLKAENIMLYDFVNQRIMDNYPNLEMINESYLLDNKELKKVFKKN